MKFQSYEYLFAGIFTVIKQAAKFSHMQPNLTRKINLPEIEIPDIFFQKIAKRQFYITGIIADAIFHPEPKLQQPGLNPILFADQRKLFPAEI